MIYKIFILLFLSVSVIFANNFTFANQNISQTHFKFDGNELFSDEALQKIVDIHADETLGYTSIESIRLAISKAYISAGYINSGATIPMQNFSSGDVIVRIIEGKLSDINIIESGSLSEDYIGAKVYDIKNTVLNTKILKDKLSLLKLDSMIDKVDAKLVPGDKKGSAKLNLSITTAQEIDAYLFINNHRSPSIGSLNGVLSLSHKNLFGDAQKLDIDLGLTKATDKLNETKGARDYNIKLTLPMNSLNLEWHLRANRGVSAVIMEPLADLDIESISTGYEVGVNYTILQNLLSKFTTGLSYNYKDVYTTLLNKSFSLGRGSEDGGYTIKALHWSLSYLYRSETFVSYTQSTIKQGLDKGDLAENLPNSAFSIWMLDYYHLVPFEDNKANLRFKLHTQFSSQELLFSEKITIGGANTVRGYREGSRSGDHGFYTTLEYQRSLNDLVFSESLWLPSFSLFGDGGMVKDIYTKNTQTLYSVGAGLKWKAEIINFDIFIANALSTKPIYQGSDWQDYGIHFNFSAKLY
ncbi:MAG: ShlB/FhaC/HecB family hemolysin secretion/activation protein [Campylobacterota bacterium]|nr:ShlB/FhaC/HecB family hemolysin secretion/activation protein [Campylobacterota bacterium]